MLKLSDIIEKTRANINEYVSAEEADTFSGETDELLKIHIDAAARMVAQVAPNYTMNITSKTQTTTWKQRSDKRYVAIFSLPSDFMRIENIAHTSLKRPVTVLLSEQHPSYGEQSSPVPGIGAGEYQPKAYRVDGSVEVHSFKDIPKVTVPNVAEPVIVSPVINYVSIPKLSGTGESEGYSTLNEELLVPVSLQAAALYLIFTGNENAKAAQEIAAASMQSIVGKLETEQN